MKFKSFLFQNPVGFLSAIIFLVAGFGYLFIDKKGAIAIAHIYASLSAHQ